MVFSRIVDAISLLKGRMPSTHSSAMRYPPTSGLPPLPGTSVFAFGYGNAGWKNSLRTSSSLQDFSAYRGIFVEDSDLEGLASKPPHPLLRDNVGDSFSKEKALPSRAPLMRKKFLRVALAILFLLLIAMLIYMVSVYIYSNWSRETSKFYVVLDCGSTGTRVFVYKASLHHRRDASLPITVKSLNEGVHQKPKLQSGRAYDRMETEPGFDKLVHNKSGLENAINPLLWWAQKQIPKYSHKTTSLFLYATAGVRRLPDTHSKWLLDSAWSILRKSPFLCERDSVRIISGTEEAYYGWAALNYRTGMFGAIPKQETFGALDLGGSSLQVTFEGTEGVQNSSGLKLRIGGNNHDLNAYSLAGYGLNDAFEKSVTRLVSNLPEDASVDLVNGKLELKHPCLLSGYRERYMCTHCSYTDKENGGSPMIGDGKLVKGKTGIPLWLVGAPNWEQCSALAKVVVNLSEWSHTSPGFDCDVQPCALPENLPRPHGHFYAMSGFFVVYRFFNLTSDATLDDVLEKGREFCEIPWDTAKKNVVPQPFIEQYCFRVPYITLLLREGLHITDKQITIGSGGITWTLGVALLEAGNSFPTRLGLPSYEKLQAQINPAILIAVLVTSLLLLCAVSCICKCMPRFFWRSYLPLSRHNSTSALSVPSPFRFQRWSPISLGEHRTKMPLSPTVSGSREGPFSFGHSVGGSSIQLESSLYPSTSGVTHSFSSSSLGQMPFDNGGMGSFWNPHRGQMRLQSRRSQSREDLSSSLSEAHLVKI